MAFPRPFASTNDRLRYVRISGAMWFVRYEHFGGFNRAKGQLSQEYYSD